jgi:hypothetical protein
MKLHRTLHILSIAILALPAAAQDNAMLIDRAVAEVGGYRITLSEVMGEVRERLFEEHAQPNADTMPAYYATALSNLVARQLVLLEYENVDTKIPEWFFNQRIERIIENGFGGDKARLVAALSEHGIPYQDWKRRRDEDTVVNVMRQQFISQNVTARPIDMERIYRERYATNSLPGRVKVSMIMLRGDADDANAAVLEKARTILSSLSTGGSFAALARTHSLESHAGHGGSWGYIDPADELRPELADALAAIRPGQVAGPIVVGNYVYLLRKDDERDDLSIPFDLVRDEIEDEILDEAVEKRFQAWISHLATKHTVRYLDEQ